MNMGVAVQYQEIPTIELQLSRQQIASPISALVLDVRAWGLRFGDLGLLFLQEHHSRCFVKDSLAPP